MSDRALRLTSLYTIVATVAAALVSPLLALSYHATAEGAEELEAGTVSAWSDPARDLVGGLITWAAPERVYATFVQLFALLFPAIFLCARAVRARRPAAGRLERWGWRSALFGYGLLSIGLLAAAVVLVDASAAVEGSTSYAALDAIFIALMLPGMAVSVLGSSLLGIGLLRNRFQPRLTAALLAVAFPALIVLSALLGHNGIALLPLFLAWSVPALRMWREGRAAAGQRLATRGLRPS